MSCLIYSVEDDADIALIINKTLSKQGYLVKTFYDGKSFFSAFKEQKPDIILLDMMLPDISGLDILKQIRKDSFNDAIQVIIISAKNDVLDKVDGLDYGADDYIEKPFDLLELMSRVASKARRISNNQTISFGNVKIDVQKRLVTKNDKTIDLTVKEYEILLFLLKSNGNIVTREELFKNVWKCDVVVESRALDMHIKSLRSKLGDDSELIKTVYGVGYKVNL